MKRTVEDLSVRWNHALLRSELTVRLAFAVGGAVGGGAGAWGDGAGGLGVITTGLRNV